MRVYATLLITLYVFQGFASSFGAAGNGKSNGNFGSKLVLHISHTPSLLSPIQLTKIKGTIALKDYEECELLADEKKPTFRLVGLNKDVRGFNLLADSDAEAKAWVLAINTCIKVRSSQMTPFPLHPTTHEA